MALSFVPNIPSCTFTTRYNDYQINKLQTFKCKQIPLANKHVCLFHDKTYLEDSNHPENKEYVSRTLYDIVEQSIRKDEPLYCIGYYLPNITIDEKFKQPIYFQACKFKGVDFSDAKFSAKTNFFQATFSDKAIFSKATFSEEANFSGATFKKKAIFSKATFSEEANFSGATFSEEADAVFTYTTFSDKADFSNAKFCSAKASPEIADFSNAKFSKEANFAGATFKKKAIFPYTSFSDKSKAIFSKATFSDKINFSGATFLAEADFSNAKFSNADFSYAIFSGQADFSNAKFSKAANFTKSTFSNEAYFSGEFNDSTQFNYVIFEEPTRVTFDISNMSKVSFSDSDVTKIRFSDKVTWGGDDRYTIIEEEVLENFLKYSFDWENITSTDEHINRLKDFLRQRGMNWEGDLQFTKNDGEIRIKSSLNSLSVEDDSSDTTQQIDGKRSYVFAKNQRKVSSMYIKLDESSKNAILKIDGNESYKFVVKEHNGKLKIYPHEEVSLESVMAAYRNLRENYEYRLRYDEAGKFFTKEMELKRMYRSVHSKTNNGFEVKENCWFRRNLSLTGLYYTFSTYGESIAKPTIIGAITIGLSALFWHIQNNPTAEPSLSIIPMSKTVSNFINVTQIWNNTHLLKAFERSLADFDPILPPGNDIKVGIIDYVVKIVGAGLTFGLLLIALRRKFERKYTR
jgi:uncharacterized protein YjbI with pentapeptide repeats